MTAKGRKIKRKKRDVSAAKTILDQLDDQIKTERRKNNDDVNYPSKMKKFSKWKMGKDISKWTPIDFFGWYLYCYREYFGEEDVTYVGKSATNNINKEKYRMSYFLKTYLKDNKQELKDYIEFCVEYGSRPDCFMKAFGFWNIFGKSLFMYKLYKDHLNGKGNKNGRVRVDDDWASFDTWKKYMKRGKTND